jgi:endonuclease/exonuclease/phosphatase family metal-dependent hydrolase
MTLKVVTINISGDLSKWNLRRDLLADQLADLLPDIIMLQEVSLPENPAIWLSDELSKKVRSSEYSVYLCPKTGEWGKREGIGVLTRSPVESYEHIPLGGQGRVAQKIRVRMEDHSVTVVNTHLFWEPGPSEQRLQQVRILIDWAKEKSDNHPHLICGDFNDTPDSHTIHYLKERYRSAYESVHKQEPAFTYPTPLPVSICYLLKTIITFLPFLHIKSIGMGRRNVLDYIFVNPFIKVLDCRLVLNRSHPDHTKIYPSDHLGLFAEVSSIQ